MEVRRMTRFRTGFQPHWNGGLVLVMFIAVMAAALLLFAPFAAGV